MTPLLYTYTTVLSDTQTRVYERVGGSPTGQCVRHPQQLSDTHKHNG